MDVIEFPAIKLHTHPFRPFFDFPGYSLYVACFSFSFFGGGFSFWLLFTPHISCFSALLNESLDSTVVSFLHFLFGRFPWRTEIISRIKEKELFGCYSCRVFCFPFLLCCRSLAPFVARRFKVRSFIRFTFSSLLNVILALQWKRERK